MVVKLELISMINSIQTQMDSFTFGNVCSFNEDSELDIEGTAYFWSTPRALSGRASDVTGRLRVFSVSGAAMALLLDSTTAMLWTNSEMKAESTLGNVEKV
jgi:hypothetical protein